MEVVLYMCFDHDLDIVLEAIVAVVSGNVVDRHSLLKLRPSTREAAAAA
jgi:putative cofactor-binding repeat protein